MTPAQRENAALVRQFLTAVVAGGDTDARSLILADDVDVNDVLLGDGIGGGGSTATRRCALAGADVDLEIEEVVAAGDKVAVRSTVSGTHRGILLNLAPTGAPFEIACAWFCRIDDGRIDELWVLPDGLGLAQQLGAVPEPVGDRFDTPSEP